MSMIRSNNIVEQTTNLNQIDEDGEIDFDDLGAEHEESSPESEDEDEWITVDKRREIGPAFEMIGGMPVLSPYHKSFDKSFDDEDKASFSNRMQKK